MAKYFTGGRAFAMDLHRPAATWTKQHALAGYLRERPELAGHIVIVGDSAADMALAEVAGGTRYLYAQPGRPFKATPADYRIHDLRDVLMAL
jgi:phosphoglycolate phosphatase-like HAD superfamily hydrolase